MKNIPFPQGGYTRITKDGKPDPAGELLLFGTYPTHLIRDEALITVLNDIAKDLPKNGKNAAWTSYKYYIFDDNEKDFMWYIDLTHKEERYRGVYFTEYRPNDTMNTSEDNCQAANNYRTNTVYWFRYESIRWKILEERENKAWVITEHCIDAQAYRAVVWENSYIKSSIRAWLNQDFLSMAFNDRERALISPEIIKNNMEDEDICAGDTPGSDTFDCIHLLSVEEAADRIASGKRQSTATDYALCQGISINRDNGNSPWWLRTPYYSIESWAHSVGVFDFFDFCTGEISNTDTGVRPALWVRL